MITDGHDPYISTDIANKAPITVDSRFRWLSALNVFPLGPCLNGQLRKQRCRMGIVNMTNPYSPNSGQLERCLFSKYK